MRRKSFGLLIQCESSRMGKEWVISTVLNHLHLFFLNFTLKLPASVDYIISPEENSLSVISQNKWKAKPSDFWSLSLILWFSFSSKCFMFSLYSFIWLIGRRKSARTHTAILWSIASKSRARMNSSPDSSCLGLGANWQLMETFFSIPKRSPAVI